jgi:hypothetical protein
MIIESGYGKNVDHTHYKLMEVPVQVRRAQQMVAHFIASYHSIQFNDVHDELQQDLMEEW